MEKLLWINICFWWNGMVGNREDFQSHKTALHNQQHRFYVAITVRGGVRVRITVGVPMWLTLKYISFICLLCMDLKLGPPTNPPNHPKPTQRNGENHLEKFSGQPSVGVNPPTAHSRRWQMYKIWDTSWLICFATRNQSAFKICKFKKQPGGGWKIFFILVLKY